MKSLAILILLTLAALPAQAQAQATEGPPEGPVWNPAEFARVDKVFIVYPLSIPWPLVAEISRGAMVYCLLADTVMARGQADFQRNGIAPSRVKFMPYFTKATFTRDFMPWVVFDGRGRPGLVDLKYWRDAEDTVANYLGRQLGVPVYPLDIAIEGGNYMSDGMGAGAATTLVYKSNTDKTTQSIDQSFKRYLGLETFHVKEDPESRPDGEVLEHVDCWAKFLAPDKLLMKRLPRSDPNYDRMEAMVEFFRGQTSSYGTPYKIFRMDAPRDEPFVNSLIVNDKVFVAIKGFGNDSAALRLYREAMPGYKVFGYLDDRPTYDPVLWYGRDALHCRTFGFTDFGILRINHLPLHDTLAPAQGGFAVEADLQPYSGRGLVPESLLVHYRTPVSAWSSIRLQKSAGTRYRAVIPAPTYDTEISYYVHAADSSGRAESQPFIGAPDPHRFFARASGVAIAPAARDDRLAGRRGTAAAGLRAGEAFYDLAGRKMGGAAISRARVRRD